GSPFARPEARSAAEKQSARCHARVSGRLPSLNALAISCELPKSPVRLLRGRTPRQRQTAGNGGTQSLPPHPGASRAGSGVAERKSMEGVMWHLLFIAWAVWARLFNTSLWNPYGASISLMLFALLLGYLCKQMLSRE